jgi:hypothetical protein
MPKYLRLLSRATQIGERPFSNTISGYYLGNSPFKRHVSAWPHVLVGGKKGYISGHFPGTSYLATIR